MPQVDQNVPDFKIDSPVWQENFQPKEDGDRFPGALLVFKTEAPSALGRTTWQPPALGSRHTTASKTLPWPVGLTTRGLS